VAGAYGGERKKSKIASKSGILLRVTLRAQRVTKIIAASSGKRCVFDLLCLLILAGENEKRRRRK